jgi:hypothetical protein
MELEGVSRVPLDAAENPPVAGRLTTQVGVADEETPPVFDEHRRVDERREATICLGRFHLGEG